MDDRPVEEAPRIDPAPAAATSTHITGTKPLAERAKNIILQPRPEWAVIDAEPATIGGIYRNYVVYLAAIGPIAGLLGAQLFGYSIMGVTYRPTLGTSIGTATVTYGLSLLSCYVLAMVIDALAPTFGGTKDMVKALKVAAYSMTASWLAGIFGLIPQLAILGLFGLYSLYLLYLGLPRLMRAPEDKAMPYTVLVIAAAIVLWLVVGALAAALVGSLFGSALMSGVG